MALQYSPKIVTDSLVMCLDASNNKSYPTDLPVKNGLVMWMDAADDTTFSYSSGTTVSQWRDKSGFNYHMVPVSAGPTRNAFLNSRKVLAFTTGQDIQNLTIDLRTSAYTIFVVDRYTNAASGTQRILTANPGNAGSNWLLGHHGGSADRYYAEGWVYASGTFTDVIWRLYMGDWSGATTDLANFYNNGTSLASNSTNASGGPYSLGINALSGERSTCEAAEIIVFNRVLSTAERRLVHTYLGQKWGISNTDRSIVDLSGNDDNGLFGNGTVANMPDYDFYNKGAFKFNGTSDFIQYPSLLNLGNVFTINFWIKPTSNTRQTIVSNGYPYLANKGFFFVCPGNNSTDIFLSLGNDQKQVQSNTGAITTGVVQMVTAVVNGAGNLMKLYVNRSEVSYAVQQNADISLQYDSGIFVTGKRDTTTSDYLSSNLYALQIYNKALSAAEVAQNYEAQKSKFANTIVQSGLVLNLDAGNPYSYAGAGTTFYDVSGNAINASASGTSYYINSNGGLLSFPNNNSYYNTSAVSTFNLGASSFSMECWVYLDAATASDNAYRGIISLGLSASNYVYIAKWRSGLYSGLYVQYIASTGTVTGVYQANDYNPVSRWTHVVATKSSNVLYLYVNGVLYSTASDLNTTFSGNSSVYIAQAHGGVNSLYGYIGESRVYNIALSAAQVLQNYNATKGRFGL